MNDFVFRFVLFWTILFNFTLGIETPDFRVICTASDLHFQAGEGDISLLDAVCTDLLYRLPDDSTKWLYNSSNADLMSFHQLHPGVRLHLSVSDAALTTLPDVAGLIRLLKETHSSGLDVVSSPWIHPSVLKRVLVHYQRVLNNHFLGLTVTIDGSNRADIVKSMIGEEIVDLVDNIFLIPGKSGIPSGLPQTKLVVGLPSLEFINSDLTTVPSLAELCRQLGQWRPKIVDRDQVSWRHPNKSWSFRMRMGNLIREEVEDMRKQKKMAGVLLYDISFGPEDNPTCAKHRELFVESVHRGSQMIQQLSRAKRAEVNNSRILGKILVFAVGEEEDRFKQYYGVVDDESLLSPNIPIDKIVLGYDDSGRIYDIYKQMPAQLSTESVFRTIHQFYVDQIISGNMNSFVSQLPPPSVIVYPDASGVLPVPVLITWVRMAGPAERLSIRKTRRPPITSTTATTTSTTTMTPPPTSSGRPCENGAVRCFLPTGLMGVLGMRQTTTRRPTVPRQITTKPATPMHPHARFAEDVEDDALLESSWNEQDYLDSSDMEVRSFFAELTTSSITATVSSSAVEYEDEEDYYSQ